MSDAPFKNIALKTLPDGTAVVGCLCGRLEDYFIIENWSEEVHRCLSEYVGPNFIIDCSGVYIITSQAIAALLSLKFAAKQRNMGFGICSLNDYNAKTFRITCLDRAFILGDSAEDTLEKIRAAEENDA